MKPKQTNTKNLERKEKTEKKNNILEKRVSSFQKKKKKTNFFDFFAFEFVLRSLQQHWHVFVL